MTDTVALHRALLARDPAAMDTLIDLYGGSVHSLAAVILGRIASAEDVEEAASDAFAAAWAQADQFDPTRSSLRTWLLMRTKYAALERRRHLLARRVTPGGETRLVPLDGAPDLAAAGPLPEEEAIREDEARTLHGALLQLPDQDRDLLIRRYFLEEPVQELARSLGLSRTAADSRLWRARQALRFVLGHLKGETAHGR